LAVIFQFPTTLAGHVVALAGMERTIVAADATRKVYNLRIMVVSLGLVRPDGAPPSIAN
jgi:hypothetical protein